TSWTGAPAAEAAGALAVLGILLLPLRELAGVWDRRCAWVIARQKCNVVFATPSSIRKRRKTAGAIRVQFESVRFRGLDITATINPGEFVLVSGPFGSGKTSLLALAVGLEAPCSGQVTFGEQERQPLSVMIGPQSPVLQGSLRRAMTLGKAKRPADEMIEAMARRFGLGALLERLGGLDARVGEGGRTLSSGERLRLHLTRASLMTPDLLAIDASEMTLDADAMAAIRDLITETPATTLIAADQTLAASFDRCWRIEAGRLLERSPDEAARQLPFPRSAA
ncbi:MAG: ATP-binding cassette domain-containing protein, partial [Geminicoccaceae bacterium]